MTYIPPTLSNLIKQAKLDFKDVDETLLTQCLANSSAASAYGLYEYINWLSRQIVPHLADEEYLLKFCNFWGVWRKEATKASGYIVFTLSNITETSIKKGIQLQNKDGVIIETIDSVITSDKTVKVGVQALSNGASSNCTAFSEFELISPVLNVENKAKIDENGLSGGSDFESIDSLRSRLLFRVHYPPSGGSKYDYVRWALECSGVTRAWCIPAPTYYNYVTVLFVLDEQTNIIPTQADLDRVATYIDGHLNEVTNQWEGKPPAAELIMQAPTLKPTNPIIRIYPDKPELREQVDAAIELLHYNLNIGDKVYLSKLRAAIANVTNVIDSTVIYPTSDITTDYYEIAVKGVIEWR